MQVRQRVDEKGVGPVVTDTIFEGIY
jgi:hypothetical protein